MTAAAEMAVVFLKKFRRDVLVAMDVSFFRVETPEWAFNRC
jgi:hypothetical protein